MASQLKRDLLKLQGGKNNQIAPYAAASKSAAKASPATVSKSSNHPKAGGSAVNGRPTQTTGAKRSGISVPKATVPMSGAFFAKKTKTGKATPNVKIKASKPMRTSGGSIAV